MPGLVGIIWNNKIDEQLLDKMAASIKHEEWYKVDKYTDNFWGIARVDLGIFNPELQPIFNEDRSICIFMYGKIYDYERKISGLKDRGHQFAIGNDAEFCLHSYEEYGTGFVRELNGSFVLAICDLKQNKLIIVNDRYGLRPLYYAVVSSKLLFASEVKAILEDKAFKKELNDETIADFFAFGEIFGNKTFFKGVEVLPPASIFVYDGKDLSIEQYWDFDYEPDYSLSEDEMADQLVQAFRKAVDIRLRDNLRYGVSLSGGLDSRSMVGAMDKEKRQGVVTFTFGIKGCDEAKIAEMVAKKAGTKHVFIELNPDELVSYAEEVVYLSDGIDVITVGFIPYAFERARREVAVIFIGQEGDVMLGGSYLGHETFEAKNDEELTKVLYARRLFSDEMLADLLKEDYYLKIKDMPLQSVKSSLGKELRSSANKSDYVTLKNHGRRFILMGSVITRNKLEEALPTYDNGFIDLILKIPPEWRFRHHIYRKFLKKLAPELARIPYNATMLPAVAPWVLWRLGLTYQYRKGEIKKKITEISGGRIFLSNKRSYVNFEEWFRLNENWNRFVKDTVLSRNALLNEFLNQEYVEALVKQHESGKMDNSGKLAYLATFELFLRMFLMDNEQREA